MKRSLRMAPIAAAVAITCAPSITTAQQLEEVIVTAQKRAESLQDVPISVSAIQGEKLQDAGIANMAALADYVPNLHIANAAVNTNIYMRGVGSGNNRGFEQSVGMYIDGVYMGRGRQYRGAFLDVERVEVLRGPQGTLFGRNTVAGAVNITSASTRAGDEFNGEIAASFEENGGQIYEGYVGGSLTDTLGARLAFKYRESDGYIDNAYLGDDEGEIEETSYRISLDWQPTDDLNVNFKYSNMDAEQFGAPSVTKNYLAPAQREIDVPNRSDFASTAYAIMDVYFPTFAKDAGKDFTTYKDNNYGQSKADGIGISQRPDSYDTDLDNAVLTVNWDLDNFTVTSITGYSAYEYFDDVDVDWLPLQFIARSDDQEYDQFSQEIRITSPGGEFFDYVGGIYYDSSDLEFDGQVPIDTNFDGLFPQFLSDTQTGGTVPPEFLPQNLIEVLTSGAYSANQLARNHNYQLDSESLAVFFQGTFNISDSFRVTVGVRYTEEEKEVESTQFLSDSITGLDTPTYNYFNSLVQASSFNTYYRDVEDDRKTDELIPSVIVQWDVFDDTMLYASFSQGFKSGGFSAADDGEPGGVPLGVLPCGPVPGAAGLEIPRDCYDPTVPNDDFEFDDETVDAFEIGGKHTLLDGGMTVNWALFYTQYSDLQTAIFKGVGFSVKNAADSEVYGLEVDALWQATDNLRLGANFAWLDATYDSFEDGPCTAIQLDIDQLCGTAAGTTKNDLSGEPTLYASDYSAAAYADYIFPLDSGLMIFVSGDLNYRDDFGSAGDNDPLDAIDAYTKVNLRVGLRGEQWEVMAYGRNIFDEDAFQQSFDTPVLAGSHSTFMEEGAVWGARFKYMF